MMTALVFVPWDPNSARTEWMSEALRMIRGDLVRCVSSAEWGLGRSCLVRAPKCRLVLDYSQSLSMVWARARPLPRPSQNVTDR